MIFQNSIAPAISRFQCLICLKVKSPHMSGIIMHTKPAFFLKFLFVDGYNPAALPLPPPLLVFIETSKEPPSFIFKVDVYP